MFAPFVLSVVPHTARARSNFVNFNFFSFPLIPAGSVDLFFPFVYSPPPVSSKM